MRESTTSLYQLYEIVAKVVEFQNVGFCEVGCVNCANMFVWWVSVGVVQSRHYWGSFC
jgi:hypothetical protein